MVKILITLTAALFSIHANAITACVTGYGDDTSNIVNLADYRKAALSDGGRDVPLNQTMDLTESSRKVFYWLNTFDLALENPQLKSFEPSEWRRLFRTFEFIESSTKEIVSPVPLPEGTDAVLRLIGKIRLKIEASNIVEELRFAGIWVPFERQSPYPEIKDVKLLGRLNESVKIRRDLIAWIRTILSVDLASNQETRQIMIDMRLTENIIGLIEYRLDTIHQLLKDLRDVRETNPKRREMGDEFLEGLSAFADNSDLQNLVKAYRTSSRPELPLLGERIERSLDRLAVSARALRTQFKITVVR